MIQIRKSNFNDLDKIIEIYDCARSFMKKNGNPTQWGDNYPDKELIKEDIKNQILYVMENYGNIYGCFMFRIGREECYEKINDNRDEKEYGIIHRVASDGSRKGVVREIVRFVQDKIINIKIDTHRDNVVMRKTLEKLGFKESGIIYIRDNSERILYQLKEKI